MPNRIRVLFKDLIAFWKRILGSISLGVDVSRKYKEHSGFMKILYHNKGIEMMGLPQLLNTRYVKDAF